MFHDSWERNEYKTEQAMVLRFGAFHYCAGDWVSGTRGTRIRISGDFAFHILHRIRHRPFDSSTLFRPSPSEDAGINRTAHPADSETRLAGAVRSQNANTERAGEGFIRG
jgi:hypothetical protein